MRRLHPLRRLLALATNEALTRGHIHLDPVQGKDRGGLTSIYVRRGQASELEAIPQVEPMGYKPEGKVLL